MTLASEVNDIRTLLGRQVKVTKTYSTTCYAGMEGKVVGIDVLLNGATTLTVEFFDPAKAMWTRVNWLRRPNIDLDELKKLEVVEDFTPPISQPKAVVVSLNPATLLSLIG